MNEKLNKNAKVEEMLVRGVHLTVILPLTQLWGVKDRDKEYKNCDNNENYRITQVQCCQNPSQAFCLHLSRAFCQCWCMLISVHH